MNESHLEFLASPRWAEMLDSDLLPWVRSAGDLGDDLLEIGPGPGRSTDLLRTTVKRLTAVEVDPRLAAELRRRLEGTNVEVLTGDGADTGLASARFSAVTAFSVLHHIPTAEHQDRVLAEIRRVLRPGGLVVIADSLDLDPIRASHEGDVFNPMDPSALPRRLERLGFIDVHVDQGEYQFRLAARRPLAT